MQNDINNDSSIRVMIVDDQKAARFGLSLLVKKAADMHVMVSATNGQEAIEVLSRMKEANDLLPQVILMDIRMPFLNGIEATERIIASFDKIKILIMTTYDQDDYALSALDAGASGYLLKDARSRDLQNAIRSVYGGDAVLTPRITATLLQERRPVKASTKRQRDAQNSIASLSPREKEVAELISQGLNNKVIAEKLVIQRDSVKKTVSRILSRLEMRDRVQIAILWNEAHAH